MHLIYSIGTYGICNDIQSVVWAAIWTIITQIRMSCFKEIQLILGNLNHPMKTTIIVHNDLSEIWATLDLLLVVIKCNLREIFATITLLCIFLENMGHTQPIKIVIIKSVSNYWEFTVSWLYTYFPTSSQWLALAHTTLR